MSNILFSFSDQLEVSYFKRKRNNFAQNRCKMSKNEKATQWRVLLINKWSMCSRTVDQLVRAPMISITLRIFIRNIFRNTGPSGRCFLLQKELYRARALSLRFSGLEKRTSLRNPRKEFSDSILLKKKKKIRISEKWISSFGLNGAHEQTQQRTRILYRSRPSPIFTALALIPKGSSNGSY